MAESVRAIPIVCLAGPTASGKTAATLALAALLAERGQTLEIISVDSALVYRGMDVGTAKPDAREQAAVRHHLIDIRDPLQPYSAAEFARDTQRLLAEITGRGHIPLLAGGTMLYFKALFEGLSDMPPAEPAVRAAIEARAQVQGWPALHAELAQVDPATAARLAPQDSQRIQRALEVWQVSGRPISSFHGRDGQAEDNASPWDWRLFSLEPHDRAWLHARIALRFEQMMQAGLVDEVQRLRVRGDLHPDLPSMRCVGYRQTWDMLDGLFATRELPERGIAATRQLAKRQITWLRSMPQRQAIACDAPDALAQTVAALLPVLQQTASALPRP
ncbi:MAG: tRNA dimethylallyltransferase [Paracidovorax wautersii]|uniref:tRNA dimethylallyltransferase n=1 Tax=Paracidovorax wautersii TaxID=1177982 RepID=A0A7V8JPQ0_9BURK|nr:MAG: tRNA dimethylallyltransferase [Paracidovorax wautersii]